MIEFITKNVKNSMAVNDWLINHKKSIENKNIDVMSIILNPDYKISSTAQFTILYTKKDKVKTI